MSPYLYDQLICNKGGKNIQWDKDSLFNKWFWEKWIDIHTKMKLGNFLMPHIKINLKWIKDLYVRPETIKILEENTSSKLIDIGLSKKYISFGYASLAKGTKANINQWGCLKMKSFCTMKEIISKMNRKLNEWEKIFANNIFNKGLISKNI